jgi:hypothetical protein
LLLVSTVTPAIVAVFTVLAAAAAGLLLAEDEGEAPAELHAASAATAAAAAGSASSIRRRAGRRLIRCALPLPPRPRIFRVVMTWVQLVSSERVGHAPSVYWPCAVPG